MPLGRPNGIVLSVQRTTRRDVYKDGIGRASTDTQVNMGRIAASWFLILLFVTDSSKFLAKILPQAETLDT